MRKVGNNRLCRGTCESRGMRRLFLLLLVLFSSSCAWGQDWLVSVRGPAEIVGKKGKLTTKDQFELVVPEQAGQSFKVRPLVYIHKDFVDASGQILGDDVNVRFGPYPDPKNTVLGSVSRGDKVRRIQEMADWVLVDWPGLGSYRLVKSPWPLHIPRLNEPPGSSPGLAAEQLQKLKALTGKGRLRPAMLVLPTDMPPEFKGSIKESKYNPRWGFGYQVEFVKGESFVRISLASGGIGDRWLEAPKEEMKLKNPLLGSLHFGKLTKQSFRPAPTWSTNWVPAPGRLYSDGRHFTRGHIGLDFSADFDKKQIEQIVAGLRDFSGN